MRLERSRHGNILVIEAGGIIDSVSAEQLGSFLQYEIETGKRYLVLDLKRVDSVGQDGLWEMVTALKRARARPRRHTPGATLGPRPRSYRDVRA